MCFWQVGGEEHTFANDTREGHTQTTMALRRARAIHNWRAAEVEEPTADLEQRRQVAGRPPASHRQVTGKSPASHRQVTGNSARLPAGKLPASHRQLGQATGKLPAGHRQVKGWRRPGQGLATARRPAGCRQLAGNPPATRRQRFSWLQGQIAGEAAAGRLPATRRQPAGNPPATIFVATGPNCWRNNVGWKPELFERSTKCLRATQGGARCNP